MKIYSRFNLGDTVYVKYLGKPQKFKVKSITADFYKDDKYIVRYHFIVPGVRSDYQINPIIDEFSMTDDRVFGTLYEYKAHYVV